MSEEAFVRTENIEIDGVTVTTLKELLRPSLRAVIIGINPSPKSVARGHYWQGRHGQAMWTLFRDWNIVATRYGVEDEDAFLQGIGFADLVRRPTVSAKEISYKAKRGAVSDLITRIEQTGGKPVIIFRYKNAYDIVAPAFIEKGYMVLLLPSPYSSNVVRANLMEAIQAALAHRLELTLQAQEPKV